MICLSISGCKLIKKCSSLGLGYVGKPFVAQTLSLEMMHRNAPWLCEGCVIEFATYNHQLQPPVNPVEDRKKINSTLYLINIC